MIFVQDLLEGACGGVEVVSGPVAEARQSFNRMLHEAFKHAVVIKENDDVESVDHEKILRVRTLPDGGASLIQLMAQVAKERNKITQNAENLKFQSKEPGEFKFGDQQDFSGGLQEIIGMPTGLDAGQWEAAMKDEHCGVRGEVTWGASDMEWTTGNYSLKTTPRKEWLWAIDQQWDGKAVDVAPGTMKLDLTVGETKELERKAITIERLMTTAPDLIYNDMLADTSMKCSAKMTLEIIKEKWGSAHVNRAEIMALRLYTGEARLRARGSASCRATENLRTRLLKAEAKQQLIGWAAPLACVEPILNGMRCVLRRALL